MSETHASAPVTPVSGDKVDAKKRVARPKNQGWGGTYLMLVILAISGAALYLADTEYAQYIKDFKFEPRVGLHQERIPHVACFGYLLMIFLGPEYMKKRDALNLKWLMVVHNVILSSFSLIVSVAIIREIAVIAVDHGYEGVNCDSAKRHPQTTLYFWFYIFYLSKMYEFVDTAILILRKKPLQLLHTYHHIITLWLCWVCLDDELSMQWLCSVANTIVHTIMYYYYACGAINVDVWWKKYVTSVQITQFVVDLVGNLSWAYYTLNGTQCSGSWFGFWFGMLTLFSFLVLFIQLYMKSYGKKPAPAKTE